MRTTANTDTPTRAASTKKRTPSDKTAERLVASIGEAMQAVPIGKTKIYELINNGVLETIKIGDRRFIKLASLRDLADRGAA